MKGLTLAFYPTRLAPYRTLMTVKFPTLSMVGFTIFNFMQAFNAIAGLKKEHTGVVRNIGLRLVALGI